MKKSISEILSKKEIDAVYQRYISGEDKKILLKEYGITEFSNQFPRILPPVELRGICNQCKKKLVVFRKARSTKYHICINCKNKITVKEYIKRKISTSFEDHEWKQSELYNQMSLRDKFFLSALLSAQLGVPEYLTKLYTLPAAFINEQICSTKSKSKEILSELTSKEIIRVDLKSNYNIDYLKGISDQNELCELNIYWKVEIFNKISDPYLWEEFICEIQNDVMYQFLKKENRVFVIDIVTELQIDELIQCLEKSLDSAQLEGELPRAALQKVFNQSLKHLSMTEIRYFIHLCIKNITYSNISSLSQKIRINSIPDIIKNYTKRSIEEGWKNKNFSKPKFIHDSEAIILLTSIFEDTQYEYYEKVIGQYVDEKQN